MDFQGSISAHVEWKAKLMKYVKNPDGSLKETVVGADNQCPLGEWLYGEGQKFSEDSTFKKLLADHAEFHKVAGGIVAAIHRGEHIDEERHFGHASEFLTVLIKVVMDLRKLHDFHTQVAS